MSWFWRTHAVDRENASQIKSIVSRIAGVNFVPNSRVRLGVKTFEGVALDGSFVDRCHWRNTAIAGEHLK